MFQLLYDNHTSNIFSRIPWMTGRTSEDKTKTGCEVVFKDSSWSQETAAKWICLQYTSHLITLLVSQSKPGELIRAQ